MLLSILFFSASLISLQPVAIGPFLIIDEIGVLMAFITIFVTYSSFLFSPRSKRSSLAIIFMTLCCIGVFLSQNILLLYFCYEASLLPILYIILKWGTYPERSLRSIILLVYTAVFTLPFIYVISCTWFSRKTLILLNLPPLSSGVLSVLTFMCFSVKLPVYGLHFWLPIAHVEAPTYGSMLLAGVLLKLGGVGLMRLLPVFTFDIIQVVLAYAIVCLPLVTWVCCNQSDIKRLVAYSSVRHMIALVPLIAIGTSSSYFTCLLIMLFHGVSSPLLFMLVGVTYSHFSTRQLILLRGLIVSSPLLSFVSIIAFLFRLSAPPFPSFVREVYFIMCSVFIRQYFLLPVFLFCLLSIVYRVNWLSSLLFSSPQPSSFRVFYYSQFMPIILRCISPLLLLIVIFSIN